MNQQAKQIGFTLIELMISITIGSLLILGAAYAFQSAKQTYSVNENLARLQEQTQYVLGVLEEDVQIANFWGLHNSRTSVFRHSKAVANPIVTAIAGDCKDNWALDLSRGINGTNDVDPSNSVLSTNSWGETCITADRYLANTDTLVIRHADTIPVAAPVVGSAYVTSEETPQSVVFLNTDIPSIAGANASYYELRSHGYYVRPYSYTQSDDVTPLNKPVDYIPMLRRISLSNGATNPVVEDEEIAIGVQDFQIEFGVDTSPIDSNERGSVNRYVTPDSLLIDPLDATGVYNPEAQVVSVRIWLLMRSQNIENDFINDTTYNYADKVVGPFNDGIRRLLVSKTLQVRNVATANKQ